MVLFFEVVFMILLSLLDVFFRFSSWKWSLGGIWYAEEQAGLPLRAPDCLLFHMIAPIRAGGGPVEADFQISQTSLPVLASMSQSASSVL